MILGRIFRLPCTQLAQITTEQRSFLPAQCNYIFPQCAELAGALRGRRHFSPCRRNGLSPFIWGGAALHIQVTIIMVRCVFCHLGDFLSNWVAWSLCPSLNYSLDLLCSLLPCIFSVILQFAFNYGYGGSIFLQCIATCYKFEYLVILHD